MVLIFFWVGCLRTAGALLLLIVILRILLVGLGENSAADRSQPTDL